VITLPSITITTFSLREYYELLFSFFFQHFEKVVKVVVVRGTPPHVHRHLLRGGEQPRDADGHPESWPGGSLPRSPRRLTDTRKGPAPLMTDTMESPRTGL